MYAACFILTMLPPILILCVGIIWKVSPPKMDSKGLAYRTALSTRSEETWELCTSPLLKALDSSWHRTWVGDRSADVVFSGPVSQFYFVASGRSDGIFLFVRLSSRFAVKKWI